MIDLVDEHAVGYITACVLALERVCEDEELGVGDVELGVCEDQELDIPK